MSKITSSSADYQTFPTLFELEPVAGKKVTVEIWNTVYLQKAIEYKKENGGLDDSLLKHISPLNWNHIQLYGRYYYKAESSLDKNQFRQLRVYSDDESIIQEEE